MPRSFAGLLPVAVVSLLVAGCSFGPPPPPQQFERLHYEYLTKIRLDVARIDVDNAWAPHGGDRHVEYRSPVQPLNALLEMANDRLVAGGRANRAVFAVEDASIVQVAGRYQATLAVRLEILDDNGTRLRGIEARVTDVHPITGGSDPAVRNDLYALTRQAMDDMNVEFEYQIRRNLNVQLQPTTPSAPIPAVGTEELGPPGSTRSAPGTPAPPPDQGTGLPTPLAPTPLAPAPPATVQPPAAAPSDQPPSDEPPSDQPQSD